MSLIPKLVDKAAKRFIQLSRLFEPVYRDQFDQWLRPSIQTLVQSMIRYQLKNEGLQIAEEKEQPNEAQIIQDITTVMSRFLELEYRNTGQTAERAGNTKTYGLVKAVFTVNPNLAEHLQTSLFKAGKQYPAYIRFSGPGPRVVPDTKDNGILSIGIKLMGVPGKKLMDDEQSTVDFSGISSPSFTTPNIQENIKLQEQIARGSPAWYFLNPFDSHYLDMVMQGLYARLHANPLALQYYSCVPYLYGKHSGQKRAIKFTIIPQLSSTSKTKKLNSKLTDNYLREAMINTLSEHSVKFDFAIQFQTDPTLMPIENASVVWPETLSPFIKVASIEIPKQVFANEKHDKLARNLTINPWHTVPDHKPLGNQNRARKSIYHTTSRVRQAINNEKHIEPRGDGFLNIERESHAAQSNSSRQKKKRSGVKRNTHHTEHID